MRVGEEAYATCCHYGHFHSLVRRQWFGEEVGAGSSKEKDRYQPLRNRTETEEICIVIAKGLAIIQRRRLEASRSKEQEYAAEMQKIRQHTTKNEISSRGVRAQIIAIFV